jgi:outer membrane lipoprotein-sorting protein
MRKSGNQNEVIQPSRAFKDLVIIIIVLLFVLLISIFFNLFAFILVFIEKHPNAITYVDEVVTSLLTLSISFAIFSWRRWQELKQETAERIRAQEELIKIANTRAETERIISKQLHCEIEERKRV